MARERRFVPWYVPQPARVWMDGDSRTICVTVRYTHCFENLPGEVFEFWRTRLDALRELIDVMRSRHMIKSGKSIRNTLYLVYLICIDKATATNMQRLGMYPNALYKKLRRFREEVVGEGKTVLDYVLERICAGSPSP